MTPWDLPAMAVGLIAGAGTAAAVSCVWVVLLIPARVQALFRVASPRRLAWAVAAGLLISALQCTPGFSLGLPCAFAAAALGLGGAFVGMLAAALGEVLEVTPVLFHRLGLPCPSFGLRLALTASKGVGAVLACLTFTL